MKLIFNKGINDMPRGWRMESSLNKRIYNCWHGMLMRCYCEKYHNTHPTYKNCYVCNRWLKLSNFIEDIKLLDNYDKWIINNKYQLDKDIKYKNNKEYNLDNCMFILDEQNTKEAVDNRNNSYCQIKINQYDLNNNFIKTWNSIADASNSLNIRQSHIGTCCKFWAMGCNKEEWSKKYKGYPNKTAGGFIWKYYKEVE